MYYNPSGHGCEDNTQTETDPKPVDGVSEGGNTSVGRMDLAGKKHPVSGVEFDSNGFPVFESKYDMQLNPEVNLQMLKLLY